VKRLAAETKRDYATLNTSFPNITVSAGDLSAISPIFASGGYKGPTNMAFDRTCAKCGKKFFSVLGESNCDDRGGSGVIRIKGPYGS
jgi:hypothetical protein